MRCCFFELNTMQWNLEMDFPFKKQQHVVYVEASLAFKLCIPFVSSPCLIAFLPPAIRSKQWVGLPHCKNQRAYMEHFLRVKWFLRHGAEIQLPDINIQQETSQNWRLVSEWSPLFQLFLLQSQELWSFAAWVGVNYVWNSFNDFAWREDRREKLTSYSV